ncbi:MAG: hypothetical protein AAF533_26495 [Acidobacteriota bacterium]
MTQAAEVVGRLTRLCLADAPAGRRLHVRVSSEGDLLYEGARLPSAENPLRREIETLVSQEEGWRLEDGEEGVSLRLSSLETLQSPEVLQAFRVAAASRSDLRVLLQLPAEVRDIQRARAALPSGPAGDREGGHGGEEKSGST